jgi:dihydroorotate dehydrogenase (NAD+) catalytic subunit
MLMAGATAVGVGTAVWYRGASALGEIAEELAAFMRDQDYASLDDLRGLIHR